MKLKHDVVMVIHDFKSVPDLFTRCDETRLNVISFEILSQRVQKAEKWLTYELVVARNDLMRFIIS